MDSFKQKELLPRVIYNFDPALLNDQEEGEQNLNGNKELNKKEDHIERFVEDHYDIEYQNEKEEENLKEGNTLIIDLISPKIKIPELEEIDGAFYLENDIEIKLNELPFIIDNILEIQKSKLGYTAKNINFINFQRNTLLLFEMKNKFPENNYLVKAIKKSLSKSMTFYHLFEGRFKNIEKLRIMLFYNEMPKKNYDEILLNTMKDYFRKNEIQNKIQYQLVFITSSYLAYNFKSLKDKIDDLENKYQKCNDEIIELRKKLNSISEVLIKHDIKLESENVDIDEKK